MSPEKAHPLTDEPSKGAGVPLSLKPLSRRMNILWTSIRTFTVARQCRSFTGLPLLFQPPTTGRFHKAFSNYIKLFFYYSDRILGNLILARSSRGCPQIRKMKLFCNICGQIEPATVVKTAFWTPSVLMQQFFQKSPHLSPVPQISANCHVFQK